MCVCVYLTTISNACNFMCIYVFVFFSINKIIYLLYHRYKLLDIKYFIKGKCLFFYSVIDCFIYSYLQLISCCVSEADLHWLANWLTVMRWLLLTGRPALADLSLSGLVWDVLPRECPVRTLAGSGALTGKCQALKWKQIHYNCIMVC